METSQSSANSDNVGDNKGASKDTPDNTTQSEAEKSANKTTAKSAKGNRTKRKAGTKKTLKLPGNPDSNRNSNTSTPVNNPDEAGLSVTDIKENGIIDRHLSTSTEASVFENDTSTNISGLASPVLPNTATALLENGGKQTPAKQINSARGERKNSTGAQGNNGKEESSRKERRKSAVIAPKSARRRSSTTVTPLGLSRRESLVSNTSASTGSTVSRRISLADLPGALGKAQEFASLFGKLNKIKDTPSSNGSGNLTPKTSEVDALLSPTMNGIQEDTNSENAEGKPVLDERVVKVLRGSLHDLPSLPSRIVRIFTSSTFTGM